MTLREMYTKIGGDYDAALYQLMNEKLMERFTQKYLDDGSFVSLKEAVELGNREDAFRAAHTLKGVAANLGFTPLQKASSDLTEQLRPLSEDPDPILYALVCSCQELAVRALIEYRDNH